MRDRLGDLVNRARRLLRFLCLFSRGFARYVRDPRVLAFRHSLPVFCGRVAMAHALDHLTRGLGFPRDSRRVSLSSPLGLTPAGASS